jgi:integrase/recombinase XerD
MRPEDFLTPEEFHQLLAACEDSREIALFMLMSGVGLRVSEAAALKIEDLKPQDGYLYVRSEVGKGKKARTCVVPKAVIEALDGYLQGKERGFIFEGRQDGHISTRQIQRILDDIAERARLQDIREGEQRARHRITPHLLRHSFALWSLDRNVPVGDLQQQLGHNSLTTTGVYLRARPNHRREAYERSGFDKMLRP